MDLTQGNDSHKIDRAKKMMLWFGIVSMVMMFAGLTSAYVVSKQRPDWLTEFPLPAAFIWSTVVIVASSVCIFLAKKKVAEGDNKTAGLFLWATLVLGLAFAAFQIYSFSEIISLGYYFTGSESTITSSFIYIIVLAHLTHLAGGIIVLFVLIYNHFKQRYRPGQMLGLEMGATYWHFVDALWVYLFLFLYFFR